MIALIDYGSGNLRSVSKALAREGGDVRLVDSPDALAGADAVVLPGVGAFGDCVRGIKSRGLWEPLRDWLGTFAMIDKWTNPTQKSASISDAEIDRLVGAVLAEPDREKVNNLMRSIFQRLRSEHLGIPLAYLHSAYATSKKIGKWNPGAVMYDLNIDDLVRQR